MGLTCEIAAKLNFNHSFGPNLMAPMKRHFLPLIAALMLAACGGGGSGGGASGPTSAPPSRGTLLQTPPGLLSTLTISGLLTELELPINALLLSVSSAISFFITLSTKRSAARAKPPPHPPCS